jgi:hypothetical protein
MYDKVNITLTIKLITKPNTINIDIQMVLFSNGQLYGYTIKWFKLDKKPNGHFFTIICLAFKWLQQDGGQICFSIRTAGSS